MTTIKDVAKDAGVSTATVSHVINGTRFVSEELCERVNEAMQRLHYQQNALARGLRQGSTKTIGLIIPDNSNPFFAELSRCIEDQGFKEGYSVILCNTDGDIEKEKTYTNVLLSKQVDGIVFIGMNQSDKLIISIINQTIPFVVVDRELQVDGVDTVLVDNFRGGYQATQHLIEKGHVNIACIAGNLALTPSADRLHGYRKALEDHGIPVLEEYIVHSEFSVSGGETLAQNLVGLSNPPTAIFACSDVQALGALKKLRSLMIAVPEQVSIVGFDDVSLATIVSPSLTTVAQPIKEIAETAIQILLTRIRHTDDALETRRVVLPTALVIRESTSVRRG